MAYFRKLFILIIAITCKITGYGQTQIDPTEAYAAIASTKRVQVLDVRTADEYASKHIEKSININWNDRDLFDKLVGKKIKKKRPVYVYCQAGGRSRDAARYLTEAGYTVYEIKGGIKNWQEEKLPLIESNEKYSGLTKQQFDQIVQQHKVVLFDFHADWCGPCVRMKPTIKKITNEYAGRVKVIIIDVDKNRKLATQLGIRSIPTLFLYKAGELSWKYTGPADEDTIVKQF